HSRRRTRVGARRLGRLHVQLSESSLGGPGGGESVNGNGPLVPDPLHLDNASAWPLIGGGSSMRRLFRMVRSSVPVLLLAVVSMAAVSTASAQEVHRLDSAPQGSFSIVVIPDTQRYLGKATK